MNLFTRRVLAAVLFLGVAAAIAAQTPAAKPATTKVADADKLDINTATQAQLKALKGVGEVYSKRIIEGRPYTAKNQLTTRGIVPTATYEGIREQIVARAPKKQAWATVPE